MTIEQATRVGVTVAIAAMAAGAGCTFQPGDRDNPIARGLSWFSYLNGDDMRKECHPGAPDRYRIVYSAQDKKQVRTYDIVADTNGPGAELVTQIRGEEDLTRAIPLGDLLAPWRSTILQRHIDAEHFAAIRNALRQSGFFVPPPDYTRLTSWGFYWLAAACVDGHFYYNGWAYPSERFADVTLAGPLKAVDRTGIPFRPPHPVEEPRHNPEDPHDTYQFLVDGSGMKGHFAF